MDTHLLKTFRKIATANGRHLKLDELLAEARSDNIGKLIWKKCHHRADMAELCSDWPGWPKCSCTCCDCTEPAACNDDGGNPCCEACADYTTDDADEVICSRDERTETVTESCGAGNQTRSYVRLKPPEMPDSDSDGEWALYWDTVGNESDVVARFSSREEAQQAVLAQDWPRPGDNTNYLCGYTVRQFVNGKWVPPEE